MRIPHPVFHAPFMNNNHRWIGKMLVGFANPTIYSKNDALKEHALDAVVAHPSIQEAAREGKHNAIIM